MREDDKMKKKISYEDVYVEITVLTQEDIITTSGFGGKDDIVEYEW